MTGIEILEVLRPFEKRMKALVQEIANVSKVILSEFANKKDDEGYRYHPGSSYNLEELEYPYNTSFRAGAGVESKNINVVEFAYVDSDNDYTLFAFTNEEFALMYDNGINIKQVIYNYIEKDYNKSRKNWLDMRNKSIVYKEKQLAFQKVQEEYNKELQQLNQKYGKP